MNLELRIDEKSCAACDNYFEPLGITKARSKELIDAVTNAFLNPTEEDGTDQVTIMHNISKLVTTPEELIFVGYKIGELATFHDCSEDPSLAKTVMLQVLLKDLLKK